MASTLTGFKFDLFFDRERVLSAIDRKTQRVLGGAGAFGMKTIRRSMRSGGKKGKISDPGEPPRYHTKMLRDGILFHYEPAKQTVVIGARLHNGKSAGSKTIPQVLEEGGAVAADYERSFLVKSKGRPRRGQRGRFIKHGLMRVQIEVGDPLTYKPRPFIAPAQPIIVKKMNELMGKIELK